MPNLCIVYLDKQTSGGRTVVRKLRHYGKPIVFKDELEAAAFVSERWPYTSYETRRASRSDILYGTPSTKALNP